MNKLDILNRDEFVSQTVKMLEHISNNKASTCFAINGTWGCGKTFVLDLLQEQLELMQSEETYTDRYLVIRYNCWKYDYYEEPLVAIVSSIMSQIEEKTKLFPDNEKKRKTLGRLKAVGVSLLSVGSDAVKAQTGLDFSKAYETLQKGSTDGAKAYEADHKYDVYFGFNKVLKEFSSLLREMSEQYTLVFLVDELDRCVPEYSIKILERLHHLTEDQSNIITVIAIDKKQLLSSVKQTFGFEEPEKYLEKFINFELKLDNGSVSQSISQKYEDYIKLFDKDLFPFEESFEECLQMLFKDVKIRTQEQIMKKVKIAHQLLYPEKKDYTFMCMEVLLAVMICVYKDKSCFSDIAITFNPPENVFAPYGNSGKPAFSDFFGEKFKQIPMSTRRTFHDQPTAYILPEKPSLYASILFNWYWMHKKSNTFIVQIQKESVYEVISNHHEELKKFIETIRLMS